MHFKMVFALYLCVKISNSYCYMLYFYYLCHKK
nr:MAG TPA: hypothetical protein [Caudoviricetes sp.]